MDHWLGKTPIIETLLFGEHSRITIFEMDVFPAKSLTAFVAPIAEDLCAPHSGIRQEIHQGSVTTGFDRCLSIFTDDIDRGAGLLVDERGELLAILGGPRLLIAALVIAVVRDGFGCVATLSDVLGEVALANCPATERRDVRVVGPNRARSPALADEVASVLTEVS